MYVYSQTQKPGHYVQILSANQTEAQMFACLYRKSLSFFISSRDEVEIEYTIRFTHS
jgi:hypothetical protein